MAVLAGSDDVLVSVIVPTHSRPALLKVALDSILAQTHANLEVVIVDDAGDPPASIPADSRIRLIVNSCSVGPALARNIGVAEARGDLICFLDDDDLYLPNRLAIAVRHMSQPVSICAGGVVGRPGSFVGRRGVVELRDLSSSIVDRTTPHLGRVAVRRDAWMPFNPLPAAEDVDWWIRIARRHEIMCETEVGWMWRPHSGPRHAIGNSARGEAQRMLLEMHSDYFETYRRARSFRWERVAWYAAIEADVERTREAAMASITADPVPARMARMLRIVCRSYRQRRLKRRSSLANGAD